MICFSDGDEEKERGGYLEAEPSEWSMYAVHGYVIRAQVCEEDRGRVSSGRGGEGVSGPWV